MGLFTIKCPTCDRLHLWFSGIADQRCEKCIKEAQVTNPNKPPRECSVTLCYGGIFEFQKAELEKQLAEAKADLTKQMEHSYNLVVELDQAKAEIERLMHLPITTDWIEAKKQIQSRDDMISKLEAALKAVQENNMFNRHYCAGKAKQALDELSKWREKK